MRNLVRRYVTVEQRKAESQGVTEDDVNEIKQDISAFRCEIVEILKGSGMNTSNVSGQGAGNCRLFIAYLLAWKAMGVGIRHYKTASPLATLLESSCAGHE